MTKEEQAVIRAAKQWWRGKRPAGWGKKLHLEWPEVNATYDKESALASAVARMEKGR